MIDISSTLELIYESGERWTTGTASEVAGDLARSAGAVLDWDIDADEEWLSLLVDNTRIAMISTKIPLIVALECYLLGSSPLPKGARFIGVPSFEDPVMCCDTDALRQAFGEAQAYGTLDPDLFSANDLWFATV
ncbi:hypothetical protein [Streptomyces sp. NRRL S-448]|uniref:hypothetical protein n=1 Tax=Streptomyces sp. NRRL S-448 TaxID=1463907 RepID=UPI00356AC411